MSNVNRNASSSANGWAFQICAGIYLFFDEIKQSKTLKIEGEKEDIEIVKYNGKKYIQVKCLNDVKNRSSVYIHYSKALESLRDADDMNTELVYFSNIVDPFNTNQTSYYDYNTCYSFDELTSEAQEIIKHKLGNNFTYKNLKIQIVRYFGDEATKRQFVENKISEFLSKIGQSDSKKSMIYDRLFTHCFANATNRYKKISKEEFVLNLIIPYLNQDIDSNVFESLSSGEFYDECVNYYSTFLETFDTDYQIFLKITSAFSKYKKANPTSSSLVFDFINSNYSDYLYLVPSSINQNIACGTVKILMYRVIQKNILLSKINKESRL